MNSKNFWPLDFDSEGEIYENPSWDLPGFRPTRGGRPKTAGASRRGGKTKY
jgi:hypothetical protein